jgi:chemotaxis protein CheZ
VIRRVLDIILVIERELLAVLLENVAPETLARIAASGEVQPSIGGEPSQQRERPVLEKLNESEVDDLLASLGF